MNARTTRIGNHPTTDDAVGDAVREDWECELLKGRRRRTAVLRDCCNIGHPTAYVAQAWRGRASVTTPAADGTSTMLDRQRVIIRSISPHCARDTQAD